MNIRQNILNWARRRIDRPVVGLDISDRSIKYIAFGSRRNISCEFFGEFDIPEGLIHEGEILDEDGTIRFLSSWLDRNGRQLRSSAVVASLPEEKSYVRIVQLPRVKRDQVENIIRWELEAHIPLKQEEIAYDYEIIEPFEGVSDHLDVSVIAFPRVIVDSYARVLNGAGLFPIALELESQAIIRAIVRPLYSPKARLIVDIGRHRTGVSIFSSGTILFTTTIQIGGATFEEQIAKEIHITTTEAAQYKKTVGLDREGKGGEVFAALVPVVAALSDELKRTIQYYHDHVEHLHGAHSRINEIFLVGGDANLDGLDTYLASTLRLPVSRADPFTVLKEEFHLLAPPLPRNQSLAFATTIGLAMRDVRHM